MYYLMKWDIEGYGKYLLIMDDCEQDNGDAKVGNIHKILKQRLTSKECHVYKEGTIDIFNRIGIQDKDENLDTLMERTMLSLL